MSDIPEVEARLCIQVNIDCPNEECKSLIDILDCDDVGGVEHDEDSFLIRQVFSDSETYDEFECEEVTCSQCKTVVNVKGLEY